jgi:hypothetical protein
MRLSLALFAILLGAVEVAAGVQELVYLGVLRSQTYPLIAGTVGAVAGAMVLAAGIALLMRSERAEELALAAAYVSIPVFVMIGIITHRAGWPITAVGMLFPVGLAVFCRKSLFHEESIREKAPL